MSKDKNDFNPIAQEFRKSMDLRNRISKRLEPAQRIRRAIELDTYMRSMVIRRENHNRLLFSTGVAAVYPDFIDPLDKLKNKYGINIFSLDEITSKVRLSQQSIAERFRYAFPKHYITGIVSTVETTVIPDIKDEETKSTVKELTASIKEQTVKATKELSLSDIISILSLLLTIYTALFSNNATDKQMDDLIDIQEQQLEVMKESLESQRIFQSEFIEFANKFNDFIDNLEVEEEPEP